MTDVARTSVRLKRIDDGHFLVPGTDLEIVQEGRWWSVYLGNRQIAGGFESRSAARAWVVESLEAGDA